MACLFTLAPIRLMYRRNYLLKLLGFVSLIAYLALALLLNLALAHVRDIPPDVLVDVDREALRRLIASRSASGDAVLASVRDRAGVLHRGDGRRTAVRRSVHRYAGLERRWNAASVKYRDAKEELIERLRYIRNDASDASDAMNEAARDLAVCRNGIEPMPEACWAAVLEAPVTRPPPAVPIQNRRLSEIPRELLPTPHRIPR
jgi:hypothetical protein